MSTARRTYISPEEYLELERKAEQRSQYFDGEVYAMAGASANHVQITTNISGTLRNLLKGRDCRVGAVDMRLFVPASGLYTYPDVFVVCGEPQFMTSHTDTLLNPIVLFEVLSESTEQFDRGKKFSYYQTIASLSDYVLVSQDQCRVERFKKQPSGDWLLSVFTSLEDRVAFPELDVELPLSEVYYLVEM